MPNKPTKASDSAKHHNRGPEPKRLKIDAEWEEAVKQMLAVPPVTVPKPKKPKSKKAKRKPKS